MASLGLLHTGVPGQPSQNGYGSSIRGTLADNTDFTTHWTVHPEVIKGSGPNRRSYWVIEHTNGHQVLFAVGDGADIGGDELIHSTWRNSSVFASSTTNTIWIALDPNGGGAASGSFYDELNVAGTNPYEDSGFWEQTIKSEAVRLTEWYVGQPATNLFFVWDDTDGRLLVFSNSQAGARSNSISVVVLSDEYIVTTGRPVDDQITQKWGILGIEADSSLSDPDVIGWAEYIFPDNSTAEYQLIQDTTNIELYDWIGSYMDPNNDPGLDGAYAAKSIRVRYEDDLVNGVDNQNVGIINPELCLFRPYGAAPVGKRRDTGAYIAGPPEMFFGWHSPLGDIILG